MQPKRELRIRKVDKGLGQGKEEALPRKDTERGKDRRRSICHGLTRKNTEKTEAETRKEAEEIATETKHFFQSRMRERRFFLAEANTTFYCISLQA